jgi:hypothetical protein
VYESSAAVLGRACKEQFAEPEGPGQQSRCFARQFTARQSDRFAFSVEAQVLLTNDRTQA